MAKKLARNSALRSKSTKDKEKKPAHNEEKSEFVELKQLLDLPAKDGKSSIKLRLVQASGETFVDTRKFITTEKYTGPGRQGIMLPYSRLALGKIIDTLSEVRSAIIVKPKK